MASILLDIALGGMAWRLAKSLEGNLRIQTELLRELTRRVEKLEERND